MDEIESVMKHYGILPVKVSPVSERVYFVNDGKNEYALKKSTLTESSVKDWEGVFHLADRLNLPGILPVYLTNDQHLYCVKDEGIYYLMPWIRTDSEDLNIGHFYKTLGQIHQNTKVYQSMIQEKFKSDFEHYLTEREKDKQILLTSVEQFEKNRYMSPFELLICTHYVRVDQAFKTLKDFTLRFIEKQEEEITWNVSLCHGQPTNHHVLQSNQLLLINWEKTAYDHAAFDLSMFLKSMTRHDNAPSEDLMNHFGYYLEENNLSMAELYLLVIYLLDGQKYMSVLQRYLNRHQSSSTPYSTIKQTAILERTYRELVFGLKFAEFIDEKEDDLLLDDLES